MKKFAAFILLGGMVLTLAACSEGRPAGNDDTGTGVTENHAFVPVYRVDVEELDPKVYPDDYPLIPIAEFEAAFELLSDGIVEGILKSYQDVYDIFGVDGAYYENCDKLYNDQLYKYYGWYADSGVSIFLTFKSDGESLEPFAYTGNGIIPKRS